MIGIRVKLLRLQTGCSITELSKKSRVSKSYLSCIERGIQKNPSLVVLSRLAKSLGTNVENLLDQKQGGNTSSKLNIDDDWVQLVHDAVQQGITKEDFAFYLEFIKFTKKSDGNA
jgi:XRE family transcriptional regulator of biofilm formation